MVHSERADRPPPSASSGSTSCALGADRVGLPGQNIMIWYVTIWYVIVWYIMVWYTIL